MKFKIIIFFLLFLNITGLSFATDNETELPHLQSVSAIVIDDFTGRVLYQKNGYAKRAMASTTKIMTCIVALENSSLNDIVTIGEKPSKINGTKMGVQKGEKVTMENMLYGMMLPSGNDAAIAIAEHIGGGDSSKFIYMMNQKAKEIGVTNTNYINPHGLDAVGHYTTAYDLALITRYALKNSVFNQIVGTKYKTVFTDKRSIDLVSTNELLNNFPNANGVKTGYTGNANRCLVGSATRDGFRVISVVLGSDTKNIRTNDSKQLLNYALNNYKLVNIIGLQTLNTQIPIKKNSDVNINIKNKDDDLLLPLKEDELEKVSIKYDLPTILEAPIEKGDYIGKAIYKVNDEIVREEEFFSDITVINKKFIDYFNILLKDLFYIIK